jgi:hypothetical protein
MSAAWLPVDVEPLRMLAVLQDRVHRGELSGALLAEIRHREDRFGLNPLARARLGWKVAVPEAAAVLDEAPAVLEERFSRVIVAQHPPPAS